MESNGTSTEDLCKICDGRIECAPAAILLISLVHALYGHLAPEPDYFRRESPKFSARKKPELFPQPFDFQKKTVVRNLSYHYRMDDEDTVNDDNFKITRDEFRRNRAQFVNYDFIVVGAGTAGCVVASRLSENRRWKVLLIEAGTEEPKMALIPGLTSEFIGSSIDWHYAMRPHKGFCQNRRQLGCEVVQGRVMGGTSTINNMAYMRGSPADYDEWAIMGNEGWSFSQVLPYFKYSEGNYDKDITRNRYFHSTQGPLDVGRYPYADDNVEILIAALNEIGFNYTDINGRNPLGVMRIQTTSYLGERVSSYTAFIDPVRKLRSNIDIITEALVTKVMLEVKGEHVKATGVEYLRYGTIFKIRALKEIIVSAGTINTAKLLMQSGIGPKDYLEYLDIPVYRDLPVGRNFQDHLSICLPILKLSKTSTLTKFPEKIKDITTYYEKGRGPLSANFQVVAFLETSFSDVLKTPDIEIRFRGHDSNMYFDRMDVCITLLTPRSRGEVILNATDPIFGNPLIYPNFLKDITDEKKLLDGIQEIMKIFDTEIFKTAEYEFDPYPILNDECKQQEHVSEKFWSCVLKYFSAPLHDYAGTCKMGPLKDSESVVDSQLKVYGVSHLRVVDASVMPKITRGSTAAATFMIAEKASDLIKGLWY